MIKFGKHNSFLCRLISVTVMFLLPFLVAEFSPAETGMAICMFLFFIFNPVYFVVLGYFSGKNIRIYWSLPLISSLAFLLGTWCFFNRDEIWFLAYAVIYFILGYMAMGFTLFISKRNTEKLRRFSDFNKNQ